MRFYAYFQEAVHEKAEEQYRIRHCIILFYLEDDTIQVNEPRQENSGIPQGQHQPNYACTYVALCIIGESLSEPHINGSAVHETIFTVCACARGKVISSLVVIIIVVVDTKIA